MRSVVTFKSTAFNTSQDKDHFINSGNYGDDLLEWLANELKCASIETDGEVGQEDHGWYVTFRIPEGDFNFIAGYRADEPEGTWIGWLEKASGILGFLAGRQNKVHSNACQVIHTILASSDRISDLAWHEKKDFDRGNEDYGTSEP